MTKQKDSETIEIRLVVTGRSDDIRVQTAKWLRSNKAEALEFLAQAKKPQIISHENGADNQIQGARIESAAFHRYLAEAISAQIAVGRGDFPTGSYTPLISQLPAIIPDPPLAPITQSSSPSPQPEDNDDDWDDDDEQPTIDID
jgi:hypothetical protein